MKYLAGVCAIIILGTASWYIASEVTATRACYTAYRQDSDDLVFQSQTNKQQYCAVTFDKIDALSLCLARSGSRMPPIVRSYLLPVSVEIERLLGYSGKPIPQLQQEHDTNCRDHVDTLFAPPAQE